MSASFAAATFLELTPCKVWGKAGVVVIKKIPGSADNVIQVIGMSLPRLTMPIAGTAAQMVALQAQVGNSGTLVFNYETTTARLEAMEPPVSIGIDNDLYFSALTFIRASAAFAVASTAILLEDGSGLLLEDGSGLLLE